MTVGRFADNADDRRAHLVGEVVWHSFDLQHDHVRHNFNGCKLWWQNAKNIEDYPMIQVSKRLDDSRAQQIRL